MISSANTNIYAKKSIIIPLNEEEVKYYRKIFELLDYEKKTKIEKKLVFHFIKDSGLNEKILNQIISLNFQKDKYYIDKNEFFIILRLIAMAQKNMPVSLDIIENRNLKLHLPVFSFFQSSNLLKKQNIFEFSENEIKSYLELFYDKKDTKKKYISKLSAILIWSKNNPNGLKDNEKILESLEPFEKKDYLNIKEFVVGCHLVYLSKIIKMPIKLPKNILQYLGRPSNIYNSNNNNADNKIKNYNNINTKINPDPKIKTNINNTDNKIQNNLYLNTITASFINTNNQEGNNNKCALIQNQSNQIINIHNKQMIKDVNNNNNVNLNTNNNLINKPYYDSNSEIDKMYHLVQEVKEKESKYQLNSKAQTNYSSNGNNSQNNANSFTFPYVNTSSSSFVYINNYDNNSYNSSNNHLYESNQGNAISNSQYYQLQNNHFNQYNVNNPIQTNSSFFK